VSMQWRKILKKYCFLYKARKEKRRSVLFHWKNLNSLFSFKGRR
jgi:hypothetical protein